MKKKVFKIKRSEFEKKGKKKKRFLIYTAHNTTHTAGVEEEIFLKKIKK